VHVWVERQADVVELEEALPEARAQLRREVEAGADLEGASGGEEEGDDRDGDPAAKAPDERGRDREQYYERTGAGR